MREARTLPVLPDNLVAVSRRGYTVRCEIAWPRPGAARSSAGADMTRPARTTGSRFTRRATAVLAGAGLMLLTAHTVVRAETTGTLPASLAEAWSTLDTAWDAAPLTFATATFVKGDVEGYGRYTPRADASFAPGEPMVVYTEPVGFGYDRVEDGYKVDLVADFEVLNASGQVLASQTGFADLGVTARKRVHEFHTTLKFAFEGLRAGDYTLAIALRDRASDKSATLTLPFSVAQSAAD